jgi:Fic family protein
MTQKERIIELFEDNKILTAKMIVDFTGYQSASVLAVLRKGVKDGVFEEIIKNGCYKLKK